MSGIKPGKDEGHVVTEKKTIDKSRWCDITMTRQRVHLVYILGQSMESVEPENTYQVPDLYRMPDCGLIIRTNFRLVIDTKSTFESSVFYRLSLLP